MKATFVGLVSCALMGLFAVGCAADADEVTDEGVADLSGVADLGTGVADLGPFEVELGLVRDAKDAHGAFKRTDAQLKRGPCYKRLVAGGTGFEMRRYTSGAAFFPKAPAAADKRAIACVDLDLGNTVAELSGKTLDAAIRYQLGRARGEIHNGGHFFAFEKGALQIENLEEYCANGGETSLLGKRAPGFVSASTAYQVCRSQGGAEGACSKMEADACSRVVSADLAKDSVDRPVVAASPLETGAYLVNLKTGTASVDPEIAAVVWKFADKRSRETGTYGFAADAAGKYVATEKASPTLTRVRYQRIDVHHLLTQPADFGGAFLERIFVTKKGSDAVPGASPLAVCSRRLEATGPASEYACSGL